MSEAEFWAGEFGDDYTQRNVDLVDHNVAFFDKALDRFNVSEPTIIEFGCGSGMNLAALNILYAGHLFGVEINETAAKQAESYGHIFRRSVVDFKTPEIYVDLVLTKGLLIHIHPNDLPKVYENLYQTTNNYILICEYYNPTPVEVPYRGHSGKLWKRDFAGEMMDIYPSLSLVDYGFTYHRDKNPQDDVNWFLLRKG